uniref:Uncharacterized protein n=1 Tax=Anguilla anguilla TaxID=7936 RepID=A0A0E9RVZ3_ANGAN
MIPIPQEGVRFTTAWIMSSICCPAGLSVQSSHIANKFVDRGRFHSPTV